MDMEAEEKESIVWSLGSMKNGEATVRRGNLKESWPCRAR